MCEIFTRSSASLLEAPLVLQTDAGYLGLVIIDPREALPDLPT